MSSSIRRRRMARNHKRLMDSPKLNLVSLMDIFTILVFFLMVNSGDVEVLQSDKTISLPKSVAEQKPDLTLLVKINDQAIVVQGRKVADVSTVMAQDGLMISGLEKELAYQSSRKPVLNEFEEQKGRSVIIMGDQDIPYNLLKKVMATCAGADYRDISLAVSSTPVSPSLESLPEVQEG